jgi:hypothetical protein
MERRRFLNLAGSGLCASYFAPQLAAGTQVRTSDAPDLAAQAHDAKAYGSGYFGEWIDDPFGLPAYKYTCNQLTDPKAVLPVDKAFRSPTDHIHQVGNDRLIAVVSNYGHVQVRQDEGSPKFLNDYFPEERRYGAGIGFLCDGDFQVSTYYPGAADTFDRFLGMGYFRKQLTKPPYGVDQVIFAPFGDDPVLVSQVTITNRSDRPKNPRWLEYWGCQNYQFSYRSLMEASVAGSASQAPQLRRDFCRRFRHRFQIAKNGVGLLESQTFLGRAPEEEAAWEKVQAKLKAEPDGFYGGPVPALPPGASMEDLTPPHTFLISLNAPVDGYQSNATNLFQDSNDKLLVRPGRLDRDLNASGPESAFVLERQLFLKPGESTTLYFLYGYLPEGFDFESLAAKYAAEPHTLLARSNSRWKTNGLRFATKSEPWIERETAWSSYYLRSGITYDSFFREHILSQGASFQYLAGLQAATRDPLQYALPLVFSEPPMVREILRYTLKEMQADGSLPYGIVGSGVPMPCIYRPSDSQLWLLWLAAEYVLATRDKSFLEQRIPPYPRKENSASDPTVLDLLSRSYAFLTTSIGFGKHGLLRLLNGDWNDSIVVTHLTPAQAAEVREHTESVLNGAMAAYVFSLYARMLEFAQSPKLAADVLSTADAQRQAVRQQWTGRWFRRAWIGEDYGWVGDKQMWLEPQPWAILGDCATSDQKRTLVAALDELVRKPSPIGALLQSSADPTMKDEPGTGTNGGIFAAIGGTLIWALAAVNGDMAWDEWKKNTLARHAAVYPDMWFGIWSGPDAYNSVLSKNPGGTGPDFPVLNMHAHAWPLYTAAKLTGVEFHENGVNFRPVLPLAQYEFTSPLLGFKKEEARYKGWYAPLSAGHWTIEIELPEIERSGLKQVRVNNVARSLEQSPRGVRFSGDSTPTAPLQWEIS